MPTGKTLGLLIKRVALENGVQSPVMVNNFLDDKTDRQCNRNETASPGTFPQIEGLENKTARDESRASSRLSSARSNRIQSPRETPRKNLFTRNSKSISLTNSAREEINNNGLQIPLSDSDLSDSENEEESNELLDSRPAFWNSFSDSIKKIHDNTDSLSLRARPNFKASDSYKEVMTNMFGNSEYSCTKGYTKLKDKIKGLTGVTSMASRIFARATQEEKMASDESDDEALDPKKEEEDKKNKISEIMGAKRGWKLIKRHVNETAKEENTKDSKMNWAFLQHHLHNMSNTEKARVDLYERYGLVPIMTENGKMECRNRMLAEQLRAESFTNLKRENNLLLSKQTGQKRAASARPSYNENWGKKLQRKQRDTHINKTTKNGPKRPTSVSVLATRLSR